MNERQVHKMLKSLADLAKAAERIADALETPMVGMPVEGAAELRPVCFTWEDAVHVIRETCVDAPECGPGCDMYEWCQAVLDKSPAPNEWPDPALNL